MHACMHSLTLQRLPQVLAHDVEALRPEHLLQLPEAQLAVRVRVRPGHGRTQPSDVGVAQLLG